MSDRSSLAVALVTVLFVLVGLGGAQDRSIRSEDFAKARPAGTAQTIPTRYKPKTKQPVVARRKNPSGPVAKGPVSSATPQLIGVTLWRLREPRPGESTQGAIRVQDANGRRSLRVPVRSSLSRPIALNDLVRLTLETQHEGYLYIIDSELRRDGTLGPPMLVFPDSAGVDNFIRPGALVDLPDRTEDLPYFRISSDDPLYAGELLTIVITSRPIPEWRDGGERAIRNIDLLAGIEERASESELFEREDAEGEPETVFESGASAGNRTRSLGEPEPLSRRLTRDQPLPQSVYQTRPSSENIIVVPIRLVSARTSGH